MQACDPAAATAAYLAQLSPAAHARATAFTQGDHWIMVWSALVAVAAGWLILRCGLAAKVQAWIERDRRRPVLAVVTVVLAFALAEFVLTLLWAGYARWWRVREYGLTSQAFGGWLAEHAAMTAITAVIFSIAAVVVSAVIRAAPRSWWLWSGAALGVLIVAYEALNPVLIQPLFNTYRPAPPGPLREAVEALAAANGAPADKIYVYDGSRQSNQYGADVAGVFGTARIILSDVMFQRTDLQEARAVVGHELGHNLHGHRLWYAATDTALLIFALFVLQHLYRPTARLMGARQLDGVADPAGYPVIVVMLTVLTLLSLPLRNSIQRIAEADADSFSLSRAREPDGIAKALVKSMRYYAGSPGRLEEIVFYHHPPSAKRIRNAMDWKAAHLSSCAAGGGADYRFRTNTVPAE
jgi:STE24 endopeptidase